MYKSGKILWLGLLAILLVALVACNGDTGPTSVPASQEEEAPADTQDEEPAVEPPAESEAEEFAAEPTEIPPTELSPSPTPAPPTETPVPPTETPTPEPELEPLPAEPQEIQFEAEDGQALNGLYYPAAVNPAPTIVLMHWAPGDQHDWVEIAYWLQNRALGGQTADPPAPWLDPSWFPAMFEDQSFAVFTFTFRGCKGGCSSFARDLWLLDAQAAMETAAALEGVDPGRMLTIGASIGSDGAPDGCYLHNEVYPHQCLGALSLSPGGYLTVPYADAVASLEGEEPPKPVWCFYATGDGASALACQSAEGDHYQTFEYEGRMHGMDLIDPNVEPDVLQLILDFVQMVYGF